MTLLDQLREELQEEGDDQQADMHTVNIRIRGHNHLIISQRVESVLNIEGSLQQVELLVLIDHLLGKTERVQWFTAQGEHRLSVHITTLGDGSAGRVTLGDEDTALLLAVVLHITEVDTAVAQLPVMQVRLLGPLTSKLCNARHGLAFLLALAHLLQHHLSHIRMLMQVVIHLGLDEVTHIFVHAHPIRTHRQ